MLIKKIFSVKNVHPLLFTKFTDSSPPNKFSKKFQYSNYSVTMDKTPLQECPEKTALQKHCEFFDQDKDGTIMPWETYKGFRDLGFGFITSTLSAFVINLFLSYPTQDSKIPNPLLPIYIKNVHRGKHTSDSDTYNTDGTINPKKFEQFQKLIRECTNGKDVITTLSETLKLSELFRQGFDPVGGTASKGEWVFLWLANDYKLDAKDIQASYDGTLFEIIAKRRADEKKK